MRVWQGWNCHWRLLLPLMVLVSFLAACGPVVEQASSDYNSFLSDIIRTERRPVGDTRGTAILDPLVLRELDVRERSIDNLEQAGLSVDRMLNSTKRANSPLSNEELFDLPSMAPVRNSLEEEFGRYNPVRDSADAQQLSAFNKADLYSKNSFFVLTGVVNRMDRAYVSPGNCGEIRLLYQLRRRSDAAEAIANNTVRPVVLNIVLKASTHSQADRSGICSNIARRWLAIPDSSSLSASDLATKLMSKSGPLELVEVANIDRIELNIQVGRAPQRVFGEARADYLLKVFHYDVRSKRFTDGPMENQIDRERILRNEDLKRDFREWLLQSNQLRELDKGTILIPDKFLSNGVIASTPVMQSNLGPAAGFVKPDDQNGAVFTESDVVAALKKAADSGVRFQNIRSVDNFKQRLNDVTCSGCHQTRGVGGLHFPGGNWTAAKPSTDPQGSEHFFGDQSRRRAILTSFRDGIPPDYSRGFSDTPLIGRPGAELAEGMKR
jgi:hypothetical protein